MTINLGRRRGIDGSTEFLTPIVIAFGMLSAIKLILMIKEWRDSKKTPAEKIGDYIKECNSFLDEIDTTFSEVPGTEKEGWVEGVVESGSPSLYAHHVNSLKNVKTKLLAIKNITRTMSSLKGSVGDSKKIVDVVRSNAPLLKSTDSSTTYLVPGECRIELGDFGEDDVVVKWDSDPWFSQKKTYINEFKTYFKSIIDSLEKMQKSVDSATKASTEGLDRDALADRAMFISFSRNLAEQAKLMTGFISANADNLAEIDVYHASQDK